MTRRNKNKVSLSEALQAFIKENKLESGIDKVRAKAAWNTKMGPAIAKYTTAVELRDDTLFVALSSSVLREELSHGRSKIVDLLNEELGKELIKKIVLR